MPITQVTLNNTAFTQVAVGACYIRPLSEGPIYAHFGTALPAVTTELVQPFDWADPLSYGGTETVYLKSVLPTGDVMVTV